MCCYLPYHKWKFSSVNKKKYQMNECMLLLWRFTLTFTARWVWTKLTLYFSSTIDTFTTKNNFTAKLNTNRPLALRGHVTNASLKQWVVLLLMPKIDSAHNSYLTSEIWEETHLREIFYSTLIFQQSSMICMGRHVGGHALALLHGGQNYFLLISF